MQRPRSGPKSRKTIPWHGSRGGTPGATGVSPVPTGFSFILEPFLNLAPCRAVLSDRRPGDQRDGRLEGDHLRATVGPTRWPWTT